MQSVLVIMVFTLFGNWFIKHFMCQTCIANRKYTLIPITKYKKIPTIIYYNIVHFNVCYSLLLNSPFRPTQSLTFPWSLILARSRLTHDASHCWQTADCTTSIRFRNLQLQSTFQRKNKSCLDLEFRRTSFIYRIALSSVICK